MKAPAAQRCDVAIVGGGMVGASLALALAATRQQVLLIEAVAADSPAQPSFDDRSTALGNGARQILRTLGVWDEIAAGAAAIREIHVSDAGHFGFARLDAADHELAAFGYTVSNRHLGAALWRALRRSSRIELVSPARVTGLELGPEWAELTVARDRVGAGEPGGEDDDGGRHGRRERVQVGEHVSDGALHVEAAPLARPAGPGEQPARRQVDDDPR